MDFSIIIPAKNEQANIGRCLDSIFAVDWERSRYEVMVIDNGSTDSTVEIARAKGAMVQVQPGLTISGLRNFGARAARGKVLAFIDADCTVSRSWLSQAARYLECEEVACFGSPPTVPDNATWVQSAWFLVRKKRETVCETEWLESMNMFVRRDRFARCCGFDESLVTCEDYDLSLRLAREGRVVSDSKIVAVHHGEAATVRHFFRKELWRGKSNFAGVFQHGLRLSEIPSLLAPSLHCLLILSFLMSLLPLRPAGYGYVIVVMMIWQTLLFVKSLRKQGGSATFLGVLQLHCLLNVYLLARGLSVLQGK